MSIESMIQDLEKDLEELMEKKTELERKLAILKDGDAFFDRLKDLAKGDRVLRVIDPKGEVNDEPFFPEAFKGDVIAKVFVAISEVVKQEQKKIGR